MSSNSKFFAAWALAGLLVGGDAQGQTPRNDVQDFREIPWNATATAAGVGVNQSWADAANTDARRWFGEDEDGSGIDAACGVRLELTIAQYNPPACQGILSLAAASTCVQSLPPAVGLVVRGGGSFGAWGVWYPATGATLADADHPLVANVNSRSNLIPGWSLRVAYLRAFGVNLPGPLFGTHVDPAALNEVVTVEQCDAYRNYGHPLSGPATGASLACHVHPVTANSALLPGIEVDCNGVEGGGETCLNGRCTGPRRPQCYGQLDGTSCTDGPGVRCEAGQCTRSECFLQPAGHQCGNQQYCDGFGFCTHRECVELDDFDSCSEFDPLPGFCFQTFCVPGGNICSSAPSGFKCGTGSCCSGGACTACSNCTDADADDVCDQQDNCPTTANTNQRNRDSDALGDACDACPDDAFNDVDADSKCADQDNCPYVANPLQQDRDGNQTGDHCESVHYAALGDSFSAGEGAGDYDPNTDHPANRCHRSRHAYSALVTGPVHTRSIQALSKDARIGPLGLFTYDFLACSGAVTQNVRKGVNGGIPKAAFTPDNVPQLDRVLAPPADWLTSDLVTISIGGNDMGFATIATFCAKNADCENDPFPTNSSSTTLSAKIPALLSNTRGRVLATLSEIRGQAPNASVLLVGYPHVVEQNCGRTALLRAAFTAGERQFLRGVGDDLNATLASAAAEAGVHFVDPRAEFAGHNFCAAAQPGQDWINGVVVAGPSSESLHPNRRGNKAYKDAIDTFLAARAVSNPTGNFGNGLPQNPIPIAPALAAPSAAVPAITLGPLSLSRTAPGPCPSSKYYGIGETVTLAGAGFAPNEAIALRLSQGTATHVLPSVTANVAGGFSATVAIPAATVVGDFGTFEAHGAVGATGEGTVLFSDTLEFVSSATVDSDADGIQDRCDLCPNLATANQTDSDFDGLGDACDACVNDPENDFDRDGICADLDGDPFAPPPTYSCGVGPEAALLLPFLLAARRLLTRRRARA